MGKQTQTKFYSDIDLSFNIHPINNDISVLYDERSIEQNLYNVIMANNGDAHFHPEKCVGIRDMLFEPVNMITESVLKTRITFILEMWMPRIRVNAIIVNENSNRDGYEITINYTTINIVEQQELILFLDRIR